VTTRPLHRHSATAPVLLPFTARDADHIAAWIASPIEAQWLAPRTRPPLTPDRIRTWGGPGKQQLLFAEAPGVAPVAYGELNALRAERGEYWLGHLIVDPQQRGRGLGTALTQALLARAFGWHAARRVVLVVFPENRAAIAAYQSAGMQIEGYETHRFPLYGGDVTLLRMAARP
jgi:RimJ/RimL family protein N-acetyltransferase